MRRLARAWDKPRGLLLDVLPTLAYLALLFWFGLIPLKKLPGPNFSWIDKVYHAAVFGGLAALLSRLLRYFGRPARQSHLLAALAATLLGGLLEVLQSFTAYRSADFADFVADALGVGIVYLALRALSTQAPSADASAG